MGGFKKFLLRGNVIDLAVAVVMGAAFIAVVNSFVKAFITPLLGVFGGVPDFSSMYFEVNRVAFWWATSSMRCCHSSSSRLSCIS